MVKVNKMMKYMSKMGQNTGMSNMTKNDKKRDITVALVALNQNLNSGNLLMKGLNSSSSFSVGDDPSSGTPSSRDSDLDSCSKEGSNFGVRNAKNKFNR